MKLTKWYPAHIKPVRVGWYGCEMCPNLRHWWDGVCWRTKPKGFRFQLQQFKWRGLAEKPE